MSVVVEVVLVLARVTVLVVDVFLKMVLISAREARIVLTNVLVIGRETVRKLVVVTVPVSLVVVLTTSFLVVVARLTVVVVDPRKTVTVIVSDTEKVKNSLEVTVTVDVIVVGLLGQQPSVEQAVGGVTVVKIVVFWPAFLLFNSRSVTTSVSPPPTTTGRVGVGCS